MSTNDEAFLKEIRRLNALIVEMSAEIMAISDMLTHAVALQKKKSQREIYDALQESKKRFHDRYLTKVEDVHPGLAASLDDRTEDELPSDDESR